MSTHHDLLNPMDDIRTLSEPTDAPRDGDVPRMPVERPGHTAPETKAAAAATSHHSGALRYYDICLPAALLPFGIDAADELPESGDGEQHAARILVVEDDPISAEIVQNILQHDGFNVDVATTADAAMLHLSRTQYNAVLMDVHLDGYNGIELMMTMRQSSEYADVPLVVSTVDNSRTTVMQAIEAKALGYLLKPIEPDALLEKMRLAVRMSNKSDSSRRHPRSVVGITIDARAVDDNFQFVDKSVRVLLRDISCAGAGLLYKRAFPTGFVQLLLPSPIGRVLPVLAKIVRIRPDQMQYDIGTNFIAAATGPGIALPAEDDVQH